MMFSKNTPNKIVLTGFRATGKSTIGLLIAKQLGYPFLDTDQFLTQQLGASIAQVVASHGWAYFRRAEAQLLDDLSSASQMVIATGGGAIEHLVEWQRLREESLVVWLEADVATINRRIVADATSTVQRPALLRGTAPEDEITQLLNQRSPLYERGSDLRLDTVSLSSQELVIRVCDAFVDRRKQYTR